MTRPIRVAHYLNQYFAQIGGEEAADQPVHMRDGPVGPGQLLQKALGQQGNVVATLVGGDNYVNDQADEARIRLAEAIQEAAPDVVVAGPAFEAGRYGVACGLVCKIAEESGVRAVTAMHPDNPAVTEYRRATTIIPTGSSITEMPKVVDELARLALKLARGEQLEPAEIEGYIPRGVRKPGWRDLPAYQRTVNMLISRLRNEPFTTELPIELPDTVAPAPPLEDLRWATIGLVTTGGLVRKGNPDKQLQSNPARYYRHDVAELESLTATEWQAYHGGYFNHVVNSNPNYILPLSFTREFEAEGRLGATHQWIIALPGVGTPVGKARGLGVDIARDLKADNVDGVLLVST